MPLTPTYVTWLIDSTRWNHYVPRAGDVVVATYPKSGTTWVQRLVSLLIRRNTEPFALDREFPWWEYRLAFKIDDLVAHAKAMTGRRCFKSHIPYDALPKHVEVRYIHVVRDPRDVALSYHNHTRHFTEAARRQMSDEGLGDPRIGVPYPTIEADPASFFHRWISEGALPGLTSGMPFLPYIPFERSFLNHRDDPNLLILHYADLKRDLVGSMTRIAGFLGVQLSKYELTERAEHATFEAMRRDGAKIIPGVAKNFEGGADTLFRCARKSGWLGHFRETDLSYFEADLASAFCPNDIRFLLEGELNDEDKTLQK